MLKLRGRSRAQKDLLRVGRIASTVALLASAASLSAVAPAIASTPAAGGDNPYSLQATALLGKTGLTDVYLNASTSNPAYPAPSTLKQVQLKSFDEAGELVYTKNFSGVPAPGGAADLQRTDLTRGQPLQVQALVQTSQAKNTLVLQAGTVVKRRPDLTFASVQAPTEVTAGAPFTVSAQVRELNGEVGGTGALTVADGESTLDEIDGFEVPAGGTTGAMFALKIDRPGTYTLTAAISNVTPGEWDTTNNTATFTVKVVEPYKTMSYDAGYSQYRESSNWEDFYAGLSGPFLDSHYEEAFEYLYSYYWTPDRVNPAGTLDFTVKADSGTSEAIHLTGLQLNGPCYYGYEPSWNANVQICQWYGGSTVYVWQGAGRYSYSYNYEYYYGEQYNYDYSYGKFLNARSSVNAKLDLPDAGGAHYGGEYTLAVNGSSQPWDYTYDDGYGYSAHNWGEWAAYSGWQYGETTW